MHRADYIQDPYSKNHTQCLLNASYAHTPMYSSRIEPPK